MIPKPYRLNLSKTTFRGPVQRGSFYLIISQSSSQLKFGVRVSKKIDTRAVVRNRLRRQIMQWLYQHRNDNSPASILVVLKRKPAIEEMSQLFNNLAKILKNTTT